MALVLYEKVHMGIDDEDGTDRYGRLIAVVYVRHNATHLLNMNKALLQGGPAEVDDFPNEFDPSTWTLYVLFPTETAPLFSDLGAVLLWLTIVVVAVLFLIVLIYAVQQKRK